MTPWKHAQSSVKAWGGEPEDYMEIHEFFDCTKQYTGDWTHRALRHHAAGVQWAIEKFGNCIYLSDGDEVSTKEVAEKHIIEDCGFIPTVQDWLQGLKKSPADWMLRVGVKSVEAPLVVK